MFENLSYDRLQLLYLGLKSLIETKSGHGLHNADGGHPAYVNGASDDRDGGDWGDLPRNSALFQMLKELSLKLKNEGIEDHHFDWWYDFNNWQSFCKFVLKCYGVKTKS